MLLNIKVMVNYKIRVNPFNDNYDLTKEDRDMYKVIGRHKEKENQKSWLTGKPLTQAKKRVYISEVDFLRYSPELIKRYDKYYYVEVYVFSSLDGWIRIANGLPVKEIHTNI